MNVVPWAIVAVVVAGLVFYVGVVVGMALQAREAAPRGEHR